MSDNFSVWLWWNSWSEFPVIIHKTVDDSLKQFSSIYFQLLEWEASFNFYIYFHLKSKKTFTLAFSSHYIIPQLVYIYSLRNNLKAIKSHLTQWHLSWFPGMMLKVRTGVTQSTITGAKNEYYNAFETPRV